MTSDLIIPIIMTIISAATPILIAALGEIIVEKSGVLNLGVEGMMLIGAVAGFIVAHDTGSHILGVLAAIVAASLASLIFGYLTLTLAANQVATGLALTIFGIGLSSLMGETYVGKTITVFGSPFPDSLSQHPFWKLIFGHSPIVYFSVLMTFAIAWFLTKNRNGLILRAVGENHLSAHSIGYSVTGVRYKAVMFGGAMAGIAGCYYSLVLTPLWAEQLTAGRGWIALALVVFAAWRPWQLFFGAYFFGAVMTMELHAKAAGFSLLAPELLAAMPYIATIVVLVIIAGRKSTGLQAPACLGIPFKPTQ